MADLMVELQQIGGSRSMAVATIATPLGFSRGFSVGFGFDFGLGWFSDRFWLILSWVSWWVSIDFELGFLVGWLDFGLVWFWVGFSNCLCWFWFNFLLILGQLCGALSTVQVACVDVGSVVVVDRWCWICGWWLSPTSSFFLCSAGMLWTMGKKLSDSGEK